MHDTLGWGLFFMPAPTKAFTAPLTLKDDAIPGAVQAVFSTFNVIDKQGDVVLPGAFTAGVPVPLIWAHEWETMPVGKGSIEVQADRAVFVGAFHLQTQHSRDAYETVKAMGDLQEYSYGFDIAAAEMGEWDGQPARLIQKFGRIYEVSPVLVGAGERTGTLAIKAAEQKQYGAPDSSYEALAQDIAEAYQAQYGGSAYPVATYPGRAILCVFAPQTPGMMTEPADMRYVDVPYVLNADGTVTLGTPQDVEVQIEWVPVGPKGLFGPVYAWAAAEAKAGRVLAERNWQRIQQSHGLLQAVMDDAAGTPASDDGKAAELRREFLRFQRLRADGLRVAG